MFLLNSSLYSDSWIPKLTKDLDVSAMVKSFKFEAQLKTCGVNDAHDSLVGVVMHHLDLFTFTEAVRKKGFVIYMDMNILGDGAYGKIGKIIGMGDNRGKKGSQYINLVQIPILAFITDSLGLDGLACFHPKDKFFFYSSSIDPTAVDYVQYFMLLDTLKMLTINGIMSMVVDCMSYESYAQVDKQGSTAKYLEKMIDVYRYSYGCNGGVSPGATNQSASPLVNGMIEAITVMDIMSRTGFVIQQSKHSVLNKPGSDITCNQGPGLFIKSEFVPQLLQPVPSTTFELGETPGQWAAFKDNQTTQGDTVFAWWVRKDFTAFAGHCSW